MKTTYLVLIVPISSKWGCACGDLSVAGRKAISLTLVSRQVTLEIRYYPTTMFSEWFLSRARHVIPSDKGPNKGLRGVH